MWYRKVYVILGYIFTLLNGLNYIESSSGLSTPTWEGGRTELEFADINNDGFVDILSIGDHGSPYINSTEHGIMVWFGNGQGSWVNYMNGDFGYGGIAIGDVNNDGHLDVGYGMHHNYSSTDFGDQLIEVALGDGTGMNWVPWDDSLAIHNQTWGMFGTDFADVDNDGDLDIGSVSFGSGDGIHIYLNLRNGRWRRSFGFLGGNSNLEFYFADFNKDGKADFAVTHQYSSVYFGDGNGNFVSAHFNLPAPGNTGYRSVAVGDVDNDGGSDLGFITSSGGVFVYIYNELSNNWENFSGNLPTSGNYQRINLWDINGDGFCDVVAQGNGVLRIWLGNGIGNWSQACQINTPSPGYGQALCVRADCDNNGCADIVMLVEEGAWPSYRNRLRFFKETSQPSSLEILPIFPKGAERFYAGSVNFIRWQSKVPNNVSSWVSVALSTSGNSGPWQILFDSLPNNGSKQWTIPNVSSGECELKLTVYTPTETSYVITSPFTIIEATPGVEEYSPKFSRPNFTYLIVRPYIYLPLNINSATALLVKIYDNQGRLVYRGLRSYLPDKKLLELNNLHLSSGNYYLTILSPYFIFNAKLIIID
ncbi:MAG: FG-GAP-like repeat-containing protein [candidate division WOR-3 bacterium]|nr:FG-GAP-like repeat-containing protein [candidate division WOR-3 bacterium]